MKYRVRRNIGPKQAAATQQNADNGPSVRSPNKFLLTEWLGYFSYM
jgi:hypothetical protein